MRKNDGSTIKIIIQNQDNNHTFSCNNLLNNLLNNLKINLADKNKTQTNNSNIDINDERKNI